MFYHKNIFLSQDFGGPSLLATPQFLYNWFPNHRGGVHGYGQAPQARAGNDGGGGGGGGGFRGHNWGQGRRLG